MPALEIIGGLATAPGTTPTALTMFTGNQATVRYTPTDDKIQMLQAWADVQGAGFLRIRSPKMHDNTQGIRITTVPSEPEPFFPMGTVQKMYAQDTLTLELTGSAVAGDIEQAAFLMYYDNLPGIEGRFIDVETLLTRGVNLMGQENTIATGVAGGWSGEEAINAEFDNFKANTDYALVGYKCSAECLGVRWRGSDTGNLGLGGPGSIDSRGFTESWFRLLTDAFKMPLIPVLNSANKSAIMIDAAQDENGADVTVTSLLVELAP